MDDKPANRLKEWIISDKGGTITLTFVTLDGETAWQISNITPSAACDLGAALIKAAGRLEDNKEL